MFRHSLTFLLLFLIVLIMQPLPLQADDQLFTDTLQLAEQGDPEAQFSMALLYDTGSRDEQNPEQAVYWFKKAAHAGVAGACLYLGMKYEFGAGVSQNRKKAYHWYEQAALQGWPQAAFMLGSLYLRSGPADQVRGCAWLGIAAEQEYPGAEQIRQQACSNLNGKTTRKIKKLRKQLLDRIYPAETPSTTE
ncbi:MAG: tetratricopeptide repeat protein [Thermodesulfobacteriota bacterium]|nr:tetratricopeptide repeat protein [Thermodesulfobacteriota bacterium]